VPQLPQLVSEQIEVKVDSLVFTVTTTSAVFPFTVLAVKVAVPILFAITIPVSDTLAIKLLLVDQVTVLLEAFSGSTVAVICCFSPTYKLILLALNLIPEGLIVAIVSVLVHPVLSLQPAPFKHLSEIIFLPLASYPSYHQS